MRDYTFLRLDISVRPVARVLEKVPGVTVTGESDEAERRDEDEELLGPVPDEVERGSATVPPSDAGRGGETPPPSEDDDLSPFEAEEPADSGGLADRLPPVVREWGLLAAGVVLLLLGVASTVLWAVLRRKRDGDESEFDESGVDSFDEPVDEWRPDRTDDEAPVERDTPEADDRESAVPTAESAASTVLDQEPDTTAAVEEASESAPTAPTEEATALDEFDEPETVEETEVVEAEDDGEAEPERPAPREVGAVDVAPLLGMGFLVVAAALVKWAQGESPDETTVR